MQEWFLPVYLFASISLFLIGPGQDSESEKTQTSMQRKLVEKFFTFNNNLTVII